MLEENNTEIYVAQNLPVVQNREEGKVKGRWQRDVPFLLNCDLSRRDQVDRMMTIHTLVNFVLLH